MKVAVRSRFVIEWIYCLGSERPSAWCKDNWIHWRALRSAFSVETQLREILRRLQQVRHISLLLLVYDLILSTT